MSSDAFYTLLKQRLTAGEWSAGQRLPSIRKFVSGGEASYYKVVSACARLASEGALTACPGRGYFVSNAAMQLVNQSEPESMVGDPLFKLLQAGPQYTKLGCGWLPPAWRDTELLAKAIRRTARLEQSSWAEYGYISGFLPLRRQHIRINCTHFSPALAKSFSV